MENNANTIETRTSFEHEDGIGIEVDPLNVRINVTKERGFFGSKTWAPAKINWPALGSVTVERAEAFARVLAKAVEVAKELDAKFGVRA